MSYFRLILRNLFYYKFYSLLILTALSLGFLSQSVLLVFKDGISKHLDKNAKRLLGADLNISARRGITEEERNKIQNIFDSKEIKVSDKSETVELYSMVSLPNKVKQPIKLSLIIGVQNSYPLYGKVQMSDTNKNEIRFSDLQANEVIVSKDLFEQLQIKVGESLNFGGKDFKVRGVVQDDSTVSWRGFSLAPYLYVKIDALKGTPLLQFGSTYWTGLNYLFEEPTISTEVFATAFHESFFNDPSIKVKKPKESSQQLGRVFGYIGDYLGLLALLCIFLSLIGANYLFQNFLNLILKQVALIKSYGLSGIKIYAFLVSHLIVLGVASSLLCIGLSWGIFPFINSQFNLEGLNILQEVNLNYVFLLTLSSSLLLPILFTLPVLKNYLKFEIYDLFNFEHLASRISVGGKSLNYLPFIIIFYFLCVFNANSIKVGTIFFCTFFASFLLLYFFFLALLKFAENKITNSNKIYLDQYPFLMMGLKNLFTYKNSTILSILSLSLGALIIFLVYQIEVSLLTEVNPEVKNKPSLFLFDIQEEQIDQYKKIIQKNNQEIQYLDPMIRGRITHLNDEVFQVEKEDKAFKTREEQSAERFRNRAVNLTYSTKLKTSEKIVSGEFIHEEFIDDGERLAAVSLERRYARRIGAGIDDILTFDILGVEIKAQVTSIRSINWSSFHPNFFIVFQPNVINLAPKTYLSTVANLEQKDLTEIQLNIQNKMPNVSMISVNELIKKLTKNLQMMALAIKSLAWMCFICSLFVLLSILLNSLETRKYTLGLLRVYGLSRGKLIYMIWIEFLILLSLALVSAYALSTVVAQLLGYFLFDSVVTAVFLDTLGIMFLILVISQLIIITGTVFSKIFSIPKGGLGDLLID
ncbi:ABC transporter permease [Bacteriovoracaceae bacterium]|nr:ABC transporter permease [Bacteriovoracaceae bacterium]